MNGMNAAEFFEALPSWDVFADNAPEAASAPTGEAATASTQTLDVAKIQDDGSIEIISNVTYTCEETPHSLSRDPSSIVMYNPIEGLLWPGALLQGASHKDPNQSLEGLLIGERDSITIAIPSLATNDNFRRVPATYSNSRSAINDMISSAPPYESPNLSYSRNTYHTEQQMALEMGLSGKYLGFLESASGDTSRTVAENTVTAHFIEKMYEVAIDIPSSPEDFFTDDFTPEKVTEQVDRGNMGADNLPIYVSNVVYGRMMMFSISSTAPEQAINLMLDLAANSMFRGENVTSNMSTQQKTILATAKIVVNSLGGQSDATVPMIRSGEWNAFFDLPASLPVASPLSYTFRYLRDGSIANIIETTEFNISTCTERVEVPGIFDFLPPHTVGLSDIASPMEIFTGDFNDDGHRMELSSK